MYDQCGPMSAKEILELYFLENRARLLEIAAFLDRIDRAPDAAEAKKDFRYAAFLSGLRLLTGVPGRRTKAIQISFSDPTDEPIESALGLKVHGAWRQELP